MTTNSVHIMNMTLFYQDPGRGSLSSEPGISRKCDYIRQNLRAYNIGSHIIFFKETGSTIVIIRILHKSMDHERHL